VEFAYTARWVKSYLCLRGVMLGSTIAEHYCNKF
jgi:hypothetical protein